MSVFSKLSPRLQQAIVARLGWSSLRPVQELAGEALLAGSNAVVLAPTAGGKTEASMFPTLSLLLVNPTEGVGALYIAPIKALLNNQADRLGLYTEMVGLRRFVWHGDTTSHERRGFLREPADLLMTTPESLEVMLVSEKIDTRKLFGDLRIVIIDEIHAIAGTDRGAHLLSVLGRIARVSRHDVQRVGLSATVGNPTAILTWLQGTSRRPATIVDPPKQPARRQLLRCSDEPRGGAARYGRHHAGPARGIIVGEGEIRWWTFAGGRINSTLRHALEALGAAWKIVPDNFGLTIRGDDLTQHGFGELLDSREALGAAQRSGRDPAFAPGSPGHVRDAPGPPRCSRCVGTQCRGC